MASYCTIGQKARLLVNGAIVGTYTAPLQVSSSQASKTVHVFTGWNAWVAAESRYQSGYYGWFAWGWNGSSIVYLYHSNGANVGASTALANLNQSEIENCIEKVGTGFTWQYITQFSPVSGVTQQVHRLFYNGVDALGFDAGINSPSSTNVQVSLNAWELNVIDGNEILVHSETYNTQPAYEIECLDLLTDEEWRDKYQNENCDDLRECLECIDLALSQLPF